MSVQFEAAVGWTYRCLFGCFEMYYPDERAAREAFLAHRCD